MHRRGISTLVGLPNRLPILPKRYVSDEISDDQTDLKFEVDNAKNVIKRKQLHKIIRCMKSSPNSSFQRCVWEYL